MIDMQNETIIPLHRARKLPWLKGRSGGQLDIGTIRRWALRGVRGVKLETLRIGGSVCTSEQAVVRFVERLSNPDAPHLPSHQHRRAATDADRRLDAAGIV
jgi:hypothetical protein